MVIAVAVAVILAIGSQSATLTNARANAGTHGVHAVVSDPGVLRFLPPHR